MAKSVLLISEARIATVQLLERILEHLEQAHGLEFRSRLLAELQPEDLADDAYPVIVRSCNPDADWLVSKFTATGVPYGFYLDDNFWLLDPETVLGQYYAFAKNRKRLDHIVATASPVIAATLPLQRWLERRASSIIQLESFFDFSLVPGTLPTRSGRSSVRVGFAASTHRGEDLVPLMSELIRVLDARPLLELEIIGVESDALPSHPRVTSFPYLDSYTTYLQFQRSRQWDIGLAPLGAAESNRYKTDNKFREYAALGIAGVYEQAEPYARVRDGETGLVASDAQSWGDAILRYCDEPSLIDRVRTAAREDAEARVSLEAVAPSWLAFFASAPSIGDSPGRGEEVRRSVLAGRAGLARRTERARLLVSFGFAKLRSDGFASTVRRTIRYLRRRWRA